MTRYSKLILIPILLILPVFCQHIGVFALHESSKKGWTYDVYSIPSYDYGDYGIQKNPLFVAAEVIYHSQNKSKQDTKVAISNANWLINNSVSHGNYSTLLFDFPQPRYDLDKPWLSAMAQARAVAAMAKAHQLTNNQTYLDSARKFMSALYVDVKEGGVTYKSEENKGWWYEEYAGKNSSQPRVLNGMMTVLRDLNRYYEYTDDPQAKFLFDKGITSLNKSIHLYDINREPYQGYSFYDVLGKPAGENYHKYHVSLLSGLLNVTKDDVLVKYYEKWRSYAGPFPKPILP